MEEGQDLIADIKPSPAQPGPEQTTVAQTHKLGDTQDASYPIREGWHMDSVVGRVVCV